MLHFVSCESIEPIVSAIGFISFVCFLRTSLSAAVYMGLKKAHCLAEDAFSASRELWWAWVHGPVMVRWICRALCLNVFWIYITIEAMGRDFVASQRHALWERICQRQITYLYGWESCKCITLYYLVRKHVWFESERTFHVFAVLR